MDADRRVGGGGVDDHRADAAAAFSSVDDGVTKDIMPRQTTAAAKSPV